MQTATLPPPVHAWFVIATAALVLLSLPAGVSATPAPATPTTPAAPAPTTGNHSSAGGGGGDPDPGGSTSSGIDTNIIAVVAAVALCCVAVAAGEAIKRRCRRRHRRRAKEAGGPAGADTTTTALELMSTSPNLPASRPVSGASSRSNRFIIEFDPLSWDDSANLSPELTTFAPAATMPTPKPIPAAAAAAPTEAGAGAAAAVAVPNTSAITHAGARSGAAGVADSFAVATSTPYKHPAGDAPGAMPSTRGLLVSFGAAAGSAASVGGRPTPLPTRASATPGDTPVAPTRINYGVPLPQGASAPPPTPLPPPPCPPPPSVPRPAALSRQVNRRLLLSADREDGWDDGSDTEV